MATITVEGIPSGVLLRLTAAAAANGRCLNSEVIVQLVRSTNAPGGLAERLVRRETPARCGDGGECRCRQTVVPGHGAGWGGPASGGAPEDGAIRGAPVENRRGGA